MIQQDQLEQAKRALKKALLSQKYYSKHLALANSARVEMLLENPRSAQKHLNTALKQNPDHCPTRHLDIKNQLNILKTQEGLIKSNESLIRCPRNWKSYAWKAYVYFRTGRVFDAKEQLKLLKTQFPEKDAQIYGQANLQRLKAQMDTKEPPL